ncbi:MAG TPA: undecaprenyl-diphosphate phosphatase [Magnetospirillaceae bacterium]|nr:undecaprenyl-diphosphate phosphatase [Magnetospirillaceae bacterium]
MPLLLAIAIAILQGVTELFPVSSLGHAVILPQLLGLPFDPKAPEYLPFLVVLHVGTAVALLLYFAKDWIGVIAALFAPPSAERDANRGILVNVIVATIPAVVLGVVFEHKLKDLFGNALAASAFLFINGFVLFFGEKVRRRVSMRDDLKDLSQLSWKGALAIGFWQCLAFFPGISRSGTTMVGGLLAGLSHKATAHFSFLIATPVILGAAVLEVPKLIHAGASAASFGVTSIIAGVVAGITAYASIAFLMRYFGKQEFEALNPFAYYCWLAGGGAFLLLSFA